MFVMLPGINCTKMAQHMPDVEHRILIQTQICDDFIVCKENVAFSPSELK
jgi:hypothetical protein